MTEAEKALKQALDCLYLEVPSSVAWDIQQKVEARIAELIEERDRYKNVLDRPALYCPGCQAQLAAKRKENES